MAKKHAEGLQDHTGTDLSQRLELVAIVDLKPHPQNYQGHPEAELAHLRHSLSTHGQYKNIVIAQDGTLLAGHGVVEAATQLGWTHITVERRPYAPDHPEAIQLLVGDNELARLRLQDEQALAALLHELHARDPLLLLGTGFDAESLAALLGESPVTVEAIPPEDFKEYDENIETEHTCPKCGYSWSGGA